MDSLHISGKLYVSSHRAAKEYGYHPDYIGQLIRSRKLKGQKVGRSWYVLIDSLTMYFGELKDASAALAAQQPEALGAEKEPTVKNGEPRSAEGTVRLAVVESAGESGEAAAEAEVVFESAQGLHEEAEENISEEPAKPNIPPILLYETSRRNNLFPPIPEPVHTVPLREHKLLTYLIEERVNAAAHTPAKRPSSEKPVRSESVQAPSSIAALRAELSVAPQPQPAARTSKRNFLGPAISLSVMGGVALIATVGVSLLYSYTLAFGG